MPEPAFITKFYLIVNPGLEELALSELQSANPNISKIKKNLGGIEFESEIHDGLLLNAKLKIPSRILLRVDDFKASDFPKLFKKLLKISWKDLLTQDTPIRFEVSSETSRLAIKKRIEDTAQESLEKYFRTVKKEKMIKTDMPKKTPPEQKIFLRFVDDICTVSIDTSGEHLHKRGYRKLIGEAPLRENLASALLSALFAHSEDINSESFELVDPMMGSGTFLLEAYHYFSDSDLRTYVFENWPFIIKNKSSKSLETDGFDSSVRQILKTKKLSGFDQDDDSIAITKENFKSLKAGAKAAVAPKFEVSQRNLFAGNFKAFPSENSRLVITNPPYGKRLKVEGKITDFYSNLFKECEQKLKPDLAGFLISDDAPETQIKTPKSWKRIEQIRFRNGGIKVRFVIFKSQTF